MIFEKNVVSPFDDNYNLLAGVGVESFSPCGKSTAILNVNSEVRITPISSPQGGIMTVGSSSLFYLTFIPHPAYLVALLMLVNRLIRLMGACISFSARRGVGVRGGMWVLLCCGDCQWAAHVIRG